MTKHIHWCPPLLVACGLAICAAPIVQAQDWTRPTVRLRATSPNVSGDVVRYVATQAQPARLDPANFDVDSVSTTNEIIARRCGNVRSEYIDELQRLNRVQLDPDQPVGEGARTLLWPACLYIEKPQAGISATVGKNDSAAKVYARLTGAPATKRQLEQYFDKPLAELARLQPGDVLSGRHLTAAVQVVPTGDVQAFEAGFSALVDADPSTRARSAGALVGEIVLPVEEGNGGHFASGTGDCIPSGSPFDAEKVKASLWFARTRQEALNIFPGQAKVIIVDGGFRGIDLTDMDSDPFARSPFPKKFFQGDVDSTIARKIVIGKPYWPVPASTAAVAGDAATRGHGTHVAGLALGGPDFAEVRRIAPYDRVWSLLTILNVSDGERSLASGAVEVLRGALGVPDDDRIVNMSISFDGSVSPDVATAFDGMVRNATNTLFVVAAGNRHRSVAGDIYPAALGALQWEHVMSVAAIGGDGRLTAFSNYGPMTVDIAAPGCQINSWLDSSATLTPLSGTSQAAPIVTFAASLIHSLIPEAKAEALKVRLVTSGDLMQPGDFDRTAYGVTLNIPKALYVFDDYVATRGQDPAIFLGRADSLTGIRCVRDPPDQPRKLDGIWAVKRGTNGLWLFAGRNTGATGKVEAPCHVADNGSERLRFTPAFRFDGATFQPIPAAEQKELPLGDVVELVMRARIN